MKSDNISFHYWNSTHFSRFKKELRYFLNSTVNEIKYEFPNVMMSFNDRIAGKNNGHLFLYDVDQNGGLRGACDYFLSKDRVHIPISVTCKVKSDYSEIEEILFREFEGKVKISKGFLGIVALYGSRGIKQNRRF